FEVDLDIHREHGSASWRYFGRLHDGAQRSFGVPEQCLRACQLDPGIHDRRRKSCRLFCVLNTLFFATKMPGTVAQGKIRQVEFRFELNNPLKMWNCGREM